MPNSPGCGTTGSQTGHRQANHESRRKPSGQVLNSKLMLATNATSMRLRSCSIEFPLPKGRIYNALPSGLNIKFWFLAKYVQEIGIWFSHWLCGAERSTSDSFRAHHTNGRQKSEKEPKYQRTKARKCTWYEKPEHRLATTR